ncbi:hypothetical protein GCM10010505_46530 [Kitasatospora aburaviensis]
MARGPWNGAGPLGAFPGRVHLDAVPPAGSEAEWSQLAAGAGREEGFVVSGTVRRCLPRSRVVRVAGEPSESLLTVQWTRSLVKYGVGAAEVDGRVVPRRSAGPALPRAALTRIRERASPGSQGWGWIVPDGL